jgi:hypothetical protein
MNANSAALFVIGLRENTHTYDDITGVIRWHLGDGRIYSSVKFPEVWKPTGGCSPEPTTASDRTRRMPSGIAPPPAPAPADCSPPSWLTPPGGSALSSSQRGSRENWRR